MRPMEAATADLDKVQFPMMASVKLDGVRALVVDGVVLGKSMKPIRNKYIQETFGHPDFEGMDGELIILPHNEDVFRRTSAAVNSLDAVEARKAKFFVFDMITGDDTSARARDTLITQLCLSPAASPMMHKVWQMTAFSKEEVLVMHDVAVKRGFEGLMLKSPSAAYKFGRSTQKQGALLKVKVFEDSEAIVLGKVELMKNNNEAKVNEKGLTSRSSHAENKEGMGTTGALLVRDIYSGVEFKIGSGFSKQERQEIWDDEATVGKVVKYKFFSKGVKDKPRFPTFLGFRDPVDMRAEG